MVQVVVKRNADYQAVDRETDCDIQHWKYVKKTKVNGKWRYYYNDIKNALSSKDEEKKLLDAAQVSNVKDVEKVIDDHQKSVQELNNRLKKQNYGSYKSEAVVKNYIKYHNTKLKEIALAKKAYEAASSYIGKMDAVVSTVRKHNSKFVVNKK